MRSNSRAVLAAAAVAVLLSGCGRGGDEEAGEALPEDETATVDEDEVAQQQTSQQAAWNCGAVKQHVYALVNTLATAESEAEGLVAALVAERATRVAAERAMRQAVAAAAAEAAAAAAAGEAVAADPAADVAEDLGAVLSEAVDAASQRLDAFQGGDDDDESDSPVAATEIEITIDSARSGFGPADEKAMNEACELYGQHESALELWASDNRGDACDVWRPAKTAADAAQGNIDTAGLHPLVSKFWVGATGSVSEGSGRCLAEQAN